MALKSRAEYTPEKALMMILNDWIAWDEETDNYLYASRGRRMGGRPTRYTVARHHVWGHIGFTASSPDVAIVKANQRIAMGDLDRAIEKERQWRASVLDASAPLDAEPKAGDE